MPIRRFSSTDNTRIWEHLNRLADDVEANEQTTLAPGVTLVKWTGTRDIEVVVSITGSFPVGITSALTGVVPAGSRPTLGNARGEAFLGSNMIGQVYVDTTGSIGVINQSGATRTLAQARIMYKV